MRSGHRRATFPSHRFHSLKYRRSGYYSRFPVMRMSRRRPDLCRSTSAGPRITRTSVGEPLITQRDFLAPLALVYHLEPLRIAQEGLVMQSGFSPGSLVRARGRDWIVLPAREPSVLHLRPLTRAKPTKSASICLSKAASHVRRICVAFGGEAGDATGVMALSMPPASAFVPAPPHSVRLAGYRSSLARTNLCR